MRFGFVALFALASFLAAMLLFSAQPMIGKMVLPAFGGTPAVWNTCLVFFQATLLSGYLLAYGLVGSGDRRSASLSLFGVAGLFVLGWWLQPIAIDASTEASWYSHPAITLLHQLCGSATLPLIVVSATAPLVQSWFAVTAHHRATDPYFLYAASNTGSLLALLAYPFVVEPRWGVLAQSQIWKLGFLALGVLVVACGALSRLVNRQHLEAVTAAGDEANAHSAQTPVPLSPRVWLRWLALVFVPSSWLMGVTTYLTTDLAAIPLFWVIPLALYFLSYVLAFASSMAASARVAQRLLPMLSVPLILVMSARFVHPIWIPLHLVTFFVGCLACHGALARERPATARLPFFYVMIALGGLLGGVWSGLIAPLVFNRILEYPLAVVLACLVALGTTATGRNANWRRIAGDCLFAGVVFALTAIVSTDQAGLGRSVLGVLAVMVAAGMGTLACVRSQRRPARFAFVLAGVYLASTLAAGPGGKLVYIERDFFGVVRVTEDRDRNVYRFFHGSTLHGQQSLDPALAREPSTYFTRSGPIGQLFDALDPQLRQPGVRVAIVGLGVGTMASYARPGQRWTFYEIDPAIERLARNPRYFHYLQGCEADAVDIVLGDARQKLKNAPDHGYQLLVLDAFSSDAVPVHLLSREAFALYRTKLAPDGVLAFNLSNRYLNLEPVMARQAEEAGLVCRVFSDLRVSEEEKRAGKQPSIWAVMAPTERDVGRIVSDPRWRPALARAGTKGWTDDYSDLARFLRFGPVIGAR
jgi:hypothetical protein